MLVDDEDGDGRIINAILTTLQRQEEGSMKLKHLIKQVVIDDSSNDKKAVKQCIKRRSDLFVIHHHGVISLSATKPRNSDGNDELSSSDQDTQRNTNGDGEVAIIKDTTSPVSINSNKVGHDSRNSKRKRKHHSSTTSDESTNNTSTSITTTPTINNRAASSLFHGLTMAISTLESKQQQHASSSYSSNEYHNYKTLKHILQSHGATMASQIHKRVHYLIVTDTAIQYTTQRVRQAYKRNVPIVNVSWIQECITCGKIVDTTNHTNIRCSNNNDEVAYYLVNEKKIDKTHGNDNSNKAQVATTIAAVAVSSKKRTTTTMSPPPPPTTTTTMNNNATGWSTPILLDCCCACHDVNDGDDADNNNCPWCYTKYGAHVDCNIIIMIKKIKRGNEQNKC